MALYPFLTFNGNCHVAMRFYQTCFGGELQLTYVGERAEMQASPTMIKELILQATLTTDLLHLVASDLGGEEGLIQGNTISLAYKATSENEVRRIYESLSQRTMNPPLPDHPLPHGQLFSVTDQFGIVWLLYH